MLYLITNNKVIWNIAHDIEHNMMKIVILHMSSIIAHEKTK